MRCGDYQQSVHLIHENSAPCIIVIYGDSPTSLTVRFLSYKIKLEKGVCEDCRHYCHHMGGMKCDAWKGRDAGGAWKSSFVTKVFLLPQNVWICFWNIFGFLPETTLLLVVVGRVHLSQKYILFTSRWCCRIPA